MSRCVGISQHVSWYERGSSIVVLDELEGRRIELNQTAAFLWLELEASSAEDALVSALVREFEVDPEVARRDVGHWVKSMIDEGLVMFL